MAAGYLPISEPIQAFVSSQKEGGGMSPVTLAEADPKLRQWGLEQIGSDLDAAPSVQKETFTTLCDPANMTNDELATIVIDAVRKIRQCIPYIISLKERFDSGER